MKHTKNSSILVAALAFAVGACGAEGTEQQDAGDVSQESLAGQLDTLDHDLEPGSSGVAVQALHEYLTRYGYFPNADLAQSYPAWRPIVADTPANLAVYDERTLTAVSALQASSGVVPTGRVDEATRALLRMPRCGVPDGLPTVDPSQKFAQASSWVGGSVTWKVLNAPLHSNPPIGLTEARAAAATALATWAAQTNLTFTQITGAGAADIQIQFGTTNPGSIGSANFPGPGAGGDVVVSNEFTWSVATPQLMGTFDLPSLLLHELGHAIGLKHSDRNTAVMFPTSSGPLRTLEIDDKVGISSLYDAWQQLPGLATDIGVGGDGTAWIIGTNALGSDFGIKRFDVNSQNWVASDGGGVRIAVGPTGVPWIVNSAGEVYRRTSNSATSGSWQLLAGSTAKDIGVGRDGSAWIIGTNALGGGDFGIKKWNGSGWTASDGGGVRIAVGPTGVPWIVNSANQIYRRTTNDPTSGAWPQLPGLGQDIGISDGNYAWLIGTAVVSGSDRQILVWDEQTQVGDGMDMHGAPEKKEWLGVNGGARSVAGGPNGRPWVVNSAGHIFRSQK